MFQRFDIHSRIVRRSGITFYGAQDRLLGREVWLWRLFEFAGTEARETDEKLKAEKAPLLTLRLPGIAPLIDIEADPDGIVALLEPVEGEPLDEWMTRGPVALADFIQIAESCLSALSATAAMGMPHGALEPGLIFAGTSEQGLNTAIIGTGIARLVMRLHGGEHEASESLDVWTLGGILHALLTGTHVEDGSPILPPHETRPEIPQPISIWVMSLVLDDVNVRPQTAADALARLSYALASAGAATGYFPPMQHAQWPAACDPNLHPPPAWHYPQVPVWHVPPAQWTQPYDPALATQQPQIWQQVPWYPWPDQVPHDPYQQHLAAQAQPRQPAAVPAAAPRPRLPVPPKSAAAAGEKKTATVPAKPKTSLKKWIGPAVSMAAAAVVVWFFRDVFAPVFRRETWQGMLGDHVTIKWPGAEPPAATPPPKEETAPPPATAKPTAPTRKTPAKKKSASKPSANKTTTTQAKPSAK